MEASVARRRGLPRVRLGPALARTLECVGLTVVFFVLNTLLGAAATLLARALTRGFVSLYMTTDSLLVGFSVLQAVAFRWWWDEGRGHGHEATETRRHGDSDD